jgi:hypothetical protein
MSRLSRKLSAPLRRRLTGAAEIVQLAVLQRVIRANRALHRGRLWIKPIERWLWLMPMSYLIGLIGGYLLLAR